MAEYVSFMGGEHRDELVTCPRCSRRLRATPEEAREVLGKALLHERTRAPRGVSREPEQDGALAVARMVLADPRGWREALGWAHEWGWDTHGYRCTRCGIRVGLPESPELCAGVPS